MEQRGDDHIIQLRGVMKSFERRTVLDSLDLDIVRGETLVVIGRSGCGKSVLLKHIIGLLRPDSGHIFIDETTAADDDHMPFIRRDVPAVDIIQLDDYPHWHSAEDTLDKVSPRSMAIVGHVLLEVLPQLEKKLR